LGRQISPEWAVNEGSRGSTDQLIEAQGIGVKLILAGPGPTPFAQRPKASAYAICPIGDAAVSGKEFSKDIGREDMRASVVADGPEASVPHPGLGARLRNYFLTGLVIVGPVAITIYIVLWCISYVDQWVKPLVPRVYNPETYLPFAVPGFGLLFSIIALTLIGALAANLIGRTLIDVGETFVARMPFVRNIYRALKQMFESVAAAAHPKRQMVQVGLLEFPSKGIWSLVYITGDATGEIEAVAPGGERDNVIVWMPTGFVPPTGFVCVVPRRDVVLLKMSAEDAAKLVMTAGLVVPDYQHQLQELAKAASVVTPVPPKASD
jgi:uncharacterized membrane protein